MRYAMISIFILLFCSTAYADVEEFPQRIRGFWTNNRVTCDILKKSGVAHLERDQDWLKISATDVLGSVQGRYFREMPKKWVKADTELSFEIQDLTEANNLEELALSRDGYLYNTIVGARASRKYQRC